MFYTQQFRDELLGAFSYFNQEIVSGSDKCMIENNGSEIKR